MVKLSVPMEVASTGDLLPSVMLVQIYGSDFGKGCGAFFQLRKSNFSWCIRNKNISSIKLEELQGAGLPCLCGAGVETCWKCPTEPVRPWPSSPSLFLGIFPRSQDVDLLF